MVALATVYVVWGSTYFGMRLALESFPPFLQSGMRFVAAGLLLSGFLAARGRPMPTARQWRDGAIVGVLLLAGGNGGVVFAEQFVSSSVAATFIGAGPLAAAIWSGLFGFWPQRLQWLGILFGFGGIVMLAGGSQLAGHPVGIAALTIAVLCWTLGSVLAQRKLTVAPGAMGFATEMLAGGAVLIVVGLARGEGERLLASWPPTPLAAAAVVYLVFFGSLGGVLGLHVSAVEGVRVGRDQLRLRQSGDRGAARRPARRRAAVDARRHCDGDHRRQCRPADARTPRHALTGRGLKFRHIVSI